MSRSSGHASRSLAAAPALLAALALAVALAAGCARDQAKATPPARAQTLLEAGNALYRAGDWAGAARRYAAAAAVAPDDPAVHFGLGMALAKLGRDEDARQAYARARELVQQPAGTAADSAP